MKQELADFKVTPKVVKSNVETEITISPRNSRVRFDDARAYTVQFLPMEQPIYTEASGSYDTVTVHPNNGKIVISYAFGGEQMHLVRLMLDGVKLHDFPVYSLLPDLFCKRPYKGDLHVHSCRSDGKEDPAVVVANYRKAGYDFMAITDHGQWKPSEEAIEVYKGAPIDISLFNGEEIHIFGNYIHAVNFGGTSVNEYYELHKAECEKEVEAASALLNTEAGVDTADIARRVWIADKIRENGGLAIFVHPHWISNTFNVGDKTSEYLFANSIYDAFELLGGQSVFENNMQTALYSEQRSLGRKIPIVGSSDSHGTEYGLNWFQYSYTVAFCEDMELETIKNSVKNFYSVAVDNYPNEHPRVHGTYRMVKYALFLLQEYFPLYQEYCFEEGRSMKDYVLGENPDATKLLALMIGRTGRFTEEFFGRK